MTREGTKPHVLLTKGWGFHIAGFWQGKSKTSATRVGGSISSRKRKARSGRGSVDSGTAASETKARKAPNINFGISRSSKRSSSFVHRPPGIEFERHTSRKVMTTWLEFCHLFLTRQMIYLSPLLRTLILMLM
jgi:hypothetical protein